MPLGTGTWVAYAFVNHKFSFYNNLWCSSVSSQMHEVGHNLGMGHSGKFVQVSNNDDDKKYVTYADRTGVMGFSYKQDDQRICFNPAKSYQTGWYSDQTLAIDPLDMDGANTNDGRNTATTTGTHRFVLNGVSDYQQNPETALVVLRLEHTTPVESDSDNDRVDTSCYIGYNRKHGVNADTVEDENKVTVVCRELGTGLGLPHHEALYFGQSTKVAALDVGESHVIENFEHAKHVQIRYVGNDSEHGGRDAIVEVVNLSRAATAVPTETPSVVPTTGPTKTPTAVPTKTPTAAPTKTHTGAPTTAPTKTHTGAPTTALPTNGDSDEGNTNPSNDNNNNSTTAYDDDETIPDCAVVTIEVVLDRYPEDIAWSIMEDSGGGDGRQQQTPTQTPRVYASNPYYDQENDKGKTIATHVCLPYQIDIDDGNTDNGTIADALAYALAVGNATEDGSNTTTAAAEDEIDDDNNESIAGGVFVDYRFSILDSYGDGLCCGQGHGFYRGLNPEGKEIFRGGTNFSVEEHFFRVLLPPPPSLRAIDGNDTTAGISSRFEPIVVVVGSESPASNNETVTIFL